MVKLFLRSSLLFTFLSADISLQFERRCGPEVIKLFSCSTELSKKFFLLISVKMPTIIGILTFMSGKKAF